MNPRPHRFHPSAPAAAPLRLPAGALLRSADERGAATLTLTQGAPVQLNAMAASALQLCDGTRSAEQIAAQLSRSGESARQELQEFLSVALSLGWVVPRQ